MIIRVYILFTYMSIRKLTGAQNRKMKAKEEEEARKSRKLMKCFLKQNAQEEQEKNDHLKRTMR